MAATVSAVESDATSAFLSDLLGSIGMGKGPDKQITDLNLKLITKIVSFLPLRERMPMSFVSHQFRGAVKASVTSINFYRDCLDGLPDEQVKEMLVQYGSQITGLNFDLFKSTFSEETSQWVWRQTVLAYASMCPNLRELSILICNRHRLRDKDLVTIFEKCPNLTKLCVDAQFLNGHCFKKAPLSLSHVEMEMCYRISDQSLRTMFGRFRKMKVLHVSQLLVLTDDHISLMVRSFRNLRELSIVSHVDTKYENLSGSGLAELGKLQKLRVLCLEGLGAVTDRTLTVISDPQASPTATTITSLSLAFCYNVSQHGLKHLGRMTSLVDLNIDGITKRDVSMGVEKIAAEGRLARLFVAERTNISPEALVAVVQSCPHLRLLDISNNEECFNWVTADKMLYLWCTSSSSSAAAVPTAAAAKSTPAAGSAPSSSLLSVAPPTGCRAPLTILTDEHLAWNIVNAPEPDEYGRSPVLVVHINRAAVPESELLPTNALSNVRPSELPPGLLAPHIRRGNRYRLLWAPLGPSKDIKVELFDENDNGASVADLALRAAHEAEDGALERSSSSIDGDSASLDHSMDGVECVESGLFVGSDAAAAAAAAMGGGLHLSGAAAGGEGNEENMPPASSHAGLPADFSFTPISADGDPHTKDWSMDVISLLLKTYAYEDGAMVGPMSIKEGIIMRPDGSVEDMCSTVLQLDASLRARYHMTAALSGARRFGQHAHNAREALSVAQADAVDADIASAIDDFLVGYVPEDPSVCYVEPSMAHLQPRPPPPKQPLRELPHDREMLQPVQRLISTDLFSPFSPSPSTAHPRSLLDGTFDDDVFYGGGGGGCENEAPPTGAAAAARAAANYFVPGGRVEGAGPKVAPQRYGSAGGGASSDHLQLQQHKYGSHHQQHRHHHHQLQQPQQLRIRPPPLLDVGRVGGRTRDEVLQQPRSGPTRGLHGTSGGRRTSTPSHSTMYGQPQPTVQQLQHRGGLFSAPPPVSLTSSSSSSSFPFPPPSHLLEAGGTAPATSSRPHGRMRAAGAAAPAWLDAGAKPHPYRPAAGGGASRPSILKPRN